MEEALSRRWKTVGDYKHGSIKRIKLTCFLTYNAVEFSPGPRCVSNCKDIVFVGNPIVVTTAENLTTLPFSDFSGHSS
jgi:hypothetical protein